MERRTASLNMATDFPLRCWAEIDLGALKENVRTIRQKMSPDTRYVSVVKTDAYGLGIRPVVEALKSSGVALFAVANVAEATAVREVDAATPILLLSATLPGEEDFVFDYDLTPTVSHLDEIDRFRKAAVRRGKTLPVHAKIDTGMGRLGIWHSRAADLMNALSAAPELRLRGLCSHLASAGEDDRFTAVQRDRFLNVLNTWKGLDGDLLIHIGNSCSLASLPPLPPFNAVRVGLLQYGILPTPDSPLRAFGVSPVVSLHARVSVIKRLPASTGISYSQTRFLKRDSRVAIVTAGYADGISRACGNRARILVRGRRCPVLGNVTMDEVMIDVTDVPEASCGDRATLVGRQAGAAIGINEYSAWSRTIPWESLCAIGKRVRRVYV